MILGHVSHGNALNFDDLQKTDNHTTRREIDEMREIQQVTKMAKKMPILSR